MTVRKRASVLAVAAALAVAAYGAARHCAPALVRYVVEQSLLQKAPAGAAGRDAATVRRRLDACLAAEPDGEARLRRLLQISAQLEKAQRLTPGEWDALLAADGAPAHPAH
ncbi:MAG: hypothetical protein LBT74_06545 [Acidobacteriota bacterium]|jgi:hypothetical protein|nr:hypothetical protein [Acidobacteriota bacterium]